MGRTKELLEKHGHNDLQLDLEYLEWVWYAEKPEPPDESK